MDADRVWLILALVFAAISIVSGLGEYVFHWWRDPGDWLTPLTALLSLVSFGWTASARDVKRLHRRLDAQEQVLREQTAILREMSATLRDMNATLREDTAVLREMVVSFRHPGA